MILFVVEDECTYDLRLYILGHEPFYVWKINTHIIYVSISKVMKPFCRVEDEYTYYLRLYILGHDHFSCGR